MLMTLSWIDLGMVVNYHNQQDVFDVQILVAVFNAVAYVSILDCHQLAIHDLAIFTTDNDHRPILLLPEVRYPKRGNDLHLLVPESLPRHHPDANGSHEARQPGEPDRIRRNGHL